MTVFSGFFNSNNNHDRMYNAQHFSRFFDGLICDGVYINYPDTETDPTNKAFYVKPAETGLAVTVAQGRAWFDGTWIWNDSTLTINLDATSNELMQRIDAIVLDIDTSDQGRQNQILVVKGTEDTKQHTVYRPTLINQPTHKQFPVAFVRVIGGAATISATNITYVVGTNDPDASPVVEALLELSSYHLDMIDQRFDEDENPVYTEAATLSEPVSGEPALTLYGKIKKLFTTLFAARNNTGNPKFLRHDLSYVEPPVVDTTKPGYCPQRPAGDAAMVNGNYKYLRADGTWTVPPGTQSNDAVAQNSAQDQDANLKVLLSQKADLVNDVDSAKWDSELLYNPSTNNLIVGKVNGLNILSIGDVIRGDIPAYHNGLGTILRLLDENDYTTLQRNFQAGVDTIYNAIVAQGVTPSSSTPSACATGIGTVATNKYNDGWYKGVKDSRPTVDITFKQAIWIPSSLIDCVWFLSGNNCYLAASDDNTTDPSNCMPRTTMMKSSGYSDSGGNTQYYDKAYVALGYPNTTITVRLRVVPPQS